MWYVCDQTVLSVITEHTRPTESVTAGKIQKLIRQNIWLAYQF